MKKIFTLFILSLTTYLGFSQTNPYWWQGNTTASNNGSFVFKNNITDSKKFINGFNFANLPLNPVQFSVKTVIFTGTRTAQGSVQVKDLSVNLKKPSGQEYSFPVNENIWRNDINETVIYVANIDAAVFNLSLADILDATNFGVNFSVNFLSGSAGCTLKNISMTIYYEYQTLLPIVLTKFDVEKTSQNFVNITWSTAAEDKVRMMYVERSSDGRNFSNLYEVAPKGAVNHSATYAVVDRAPLQGTNFYRLKEVDFDGNVAYFEVKQVSIAGSSRRFQALYNGSNIKVNVVNVPGEYMLSLIDANGAVLASKMISLNSSNLQTDLPIPAKRTGIYMVNLKGNGTNITEKVFVQQ